tara:strand:+ start:2580 stop:3569 length:990 start_codon:yes stop_codon:yes gene_type:complete
MKSEPPDDKTLRKVLADIRKGYSLAVKGGEKAYVRHFGNEDQEELESHYQEIYDKARARGLPTEQEAMDLLIKEDIWTQEDETAFVENKKYIETLQETKRNLIIPSQIRSVEEDLDKANQDLNEKFAKRQSLLAETCESYARNKSNDYSIYLSFFKTPEMSEKYFSLEEFHEISKPKLAEWFAAYSNAVEILSIENIKYLAISNVFSMYYGILGGANIYKFIQRPVYEFSFYQLNLLNYAKVLHSILENVEKIPESVKKDPDQLMSYAESNNKRRETVQKGEGKQGFSVMGATQKDMGEMGVKDELSVSPFELAKEKGSLTIEDFKNFM